MPSKESHSGTTDLGALWTNAVKDYMNRTGKDMSHLRAQSLADVMKSTEGSLKAFGGFRHNDGKVDKVRSAFSRHLEDMQTCLNGIEKVGTALSVFPPAAPVGIIFAACGHLLSAFAGVKADYDRVEAFFEHSGRFFERLSILENRADSGPLAMAVVRVFSAQLSICGHVEAMMKGKRFKQWLNALWNLEDKDLAAAYATMQASIEELGATVGYASYSAIRVTQESVGDVQEKVDELDRNISQFRSTLTESVQALYASNLNLADQISDGFLSMHAKQDESHAMQLRLVRQQEQILKAVENRGKGQQAGLKLKRNGDAADNNVQALGRIKSFFEERNKDYEPILDVQNCNRAQASAIREAFLPGTSTWLFEEADIDSWLNGDVPILSIRGPDGVGKSFLAYSVLQRLLENDPDSSNTAYFYFREGAEFLGKMEDAFACCAIQLAESNSRYAQYVATKLRENAVKPIDIPVWTRFFTSVFKSSTHNLGRLYLIFDGLEEIEDSERELFVRFAEELAREKPKISLLITSSPMGRLAIEHLQPSFVDVTKKKITPDLKTIVKHRIRTLPRLTRLRLAVKKAIARAVVEHADCMLYVEHMLRRLSDIGREDFIIKALKDMPTSLIDLYRLLLEECARDRSDAQFHTLKTLFAWLAFSKRPLELNEGWHIVHLASPNPESPTLDLEAEIIGRSSRILELSGDQLSGDVALGSYFDDVTLESDDEEASHGEDPLSFNSPPPILAFQERSLRHYFRSAKTGTNGAKDLRTPADEAHVLIVTMCADMLKRSDIPVKIDTFREGRLISQWNEHFKELKSVETAGNDIVIRVVDSLYCILNLSQKRPWLFQEPELYLPRSSDMKQWYDKAVDWAAKITHLPPGSVSQEVGAWAAEVDATSIVFTLARALFVAWTEADNLHSIIDAWRYLLPALNLHRQLQLKEALPSSSIEKTVLLVADIFDPGAESWKTLGAIGATISQPELDDRKTVFIASGNEKNLNFLKQSLERLEESCAEKPPEVYYKEKFGLLRLIVDTHNFGDDWEAKVAYIDDALAVCSSLKGMEVPVGERQVLEWQEQSLVDDKVRALREGSQREAAFELLDNTMKSASNDASRWGPLWQIEDLCEEMDPTGQKFVDILRTWSETQWHDWFTSGHAYILDDNDLKRFARWAKASREDNFLLQKCLVTIEKCCLAERNTLCTVRVRSVLAYLYQTVVGDDEKAKELRILILKTKIGPQNGWTKEIRECMADEWVRLARLIHSEFQRSTSLEQRESLLKELRTMPRIHTNDDLKDSYVEMLMGDMLRVLGPARDFYRHMNEAFETCMEGLQDSVSYNDGPSLRLLAQILSSFHGLERDAQIAYSAQYSVLDRSVEDEEREYRRNYVRTLATDMPLDEHTLRDNPSDAEEPNSRSPSPGQNTQGETDEGNTLPSPTPSSPVEEARSKGPTTPIVIRWEPWMDDEDRSGYWDVCVVCGTDYEGVPVIQSHWHRDMYLCLRCPSTQVCESCFDGEVKKRRAGIEPDDRASYFCQEGHTYLKGCMRGWKGIKNGVMRIDDEEMLVIEWLKGLKEVRWKKAWEMYWTGLGRKGDIIDID